MLDRDMGWSKYRKTVGTTALEFPITEDGYVMIHNTHATAVITVYPSQKADSGITIEPGTKRTLPRLPSGSLVWIVSDTASTNVDLYMSPNKWGADWMMDEFVAPSATPVSGAMLSSSRDTGRTGSATITMDFAGTLGRHGKGFSLLADALTQVVITLHGGGTAATFRITANSAFSFPFGPDAVEIESVTITDLSAATWHFDFVGY
jgi:hypothetical protein